MHDRLILSNIINDEGESSDFISLLSQEEEDQMNKENLPTTLPILPLRNTILFPGVVMPITVARDKSIQLLKEAYKNGDKLVGVVAQLSSDIEEPKLKDLYSIGTVATILRMIKMPDGSTMAVIQGKRRFLIDSAVQEEPYIKALVTALPEGDLIEDDESKALW